MKIIARIHTDFSSKFGIPRQSGLADTRGVIVFEPEYRNMDALKGIEQYSHLWIIWEFSESICETWRPTVRPPRLGGNKRVGVFATRSPFRPNPLGLSCVKLEQIQETKDKGYVLVVSGADMLDGTPIYDIKPYLPYVDSHVDARGGFAEERKNACLEVIIPAEWEELIPKSHQDIIRQLLAQDPRPSYQNDHLRIYGMEYAGMDIRFRVEEDNLVVCEVIHMNKSGQ